MALTVEEFIESAWAGPIVRRRSRPYRNHPILSCDDQMQEARLVLTQVWQRYSRVKPEGELRRIGTQAVIFHLESLWRMSQALSRGGDGGAERTRLRALKGHAPASVVCMLSLDANIEETGDVTLGLLSRDVRKLSTQPQALDSLVMREALDRTLTPEEAVALRGMLDPEAEPAGPMKNSGLFRRLRKKVYGAVRGGGYTSVGKKRGVRKNCIVS